MLPADVARCTGIVLQRDELMGILREGPHKLCAGCLRFTTPPCDRQAWTEPAMKFHPVSGEASCVMRLPAAPGLG